MINFETIRTIRNSKKMTLVELSKKTGISHSNLSQLERNKMKMVALRTVEKILEPLGYRLVIAPSPKHLNCPCHFPTQGTTETYKEETLD